MIVRYAVSTHANMKRAKVQLRWAFRLRTVFVYLTFIATFRHTDAILAYIERTIRTLQTSVLRARLFIRTERSTATNVWWKGFFHRSSNAFAFWIANVTFSKTFLVGATRRKRFSICCIDAKSVLALETARQRRSGTR